MLTVFLTKLAFGSEILAVEFCIRFREFEYPGSSFRNSLVTDKVSKVIEEFEVGFWPFRKFRKDLLDELIKGKDNSDAMKDIGKIDFASRFRA